MVSDQGNLIEMKVFASEMEPCATELPVGTLVTDNKKILKVAARDGFIRLMQVQQAGKKSMSVADFLRGTPLTGSWKTA